MENKYHCPLCGHQFEQGECNFNYDTALLDFTCPECDWEGNENQVVDDSGWEEARQLLEEKVKSCGFEDEMYSLVFGKVGECINEVEDELGEIADDDDTMWYDEVRKDMMQLLYDRIGEWLNNHTC